MMPFAAIHRIIGQPSEWPISGLLKLAWLLNFCLH